MKYIILLALFFISCTVQLEDSCPEFNITSCLEGGEIVTINGSDGCPLQYCEKQNNDCPDVCPDYAAPLCDGPLDFVNDGCGCLMPVCSCDSECLPLEECSDGFVATYVDDDCGCKNTVCVEESAADKCERILDDCFIEGFISEECNACREFVPCTNKGELLKSGISRGFEYSVGECCSSYSTNYNGWQVSIDGTCYEEVRSYNWVGMNPFGEGSRYFCDECGDGVCSEVETVCTCSKDCDDKSTYDTMQDWCNSDKFRIFCSNGARETYSEGLNLLCNSC